MTDRTIDPEAEATRLMLRYGRAKADLWSTLGTAASAATGLGIVAGVVGLVKLIQVAF